MGWEKIAYWEVVCRGRTPSKKRGEKKDDCRISNSQKTGRPRQLVAVSTRGRRWLGPVESTERLAGSRLNHAEKTSVRGVVNGRGKRGRWNLFEGEREKEGVK